MMNKILTFACIAAACAATVLADGYVRSSVAIPTGAGKVVAVSFGRGKTAEPIAYDISGVTATNGTCAVYCIRNVDGAPVTNVLVSAVACASTNTITVSSYKNYLYGEPLLFLFSDAKGGTVTAYAKTKE